MPFSFEPTELAGVVIIEPKVYVDPRGFFMETYKKSEFAGGGIDADFVQENHSRSVVGTLTPGKMLSNIVHSFGRTQRRVPSDPEAAYRRYCSRIATAGVERHPSEGPRSYAERAATLLPDSAGEIRALSVSFIELRYAPHGSPEQAREWMRRARRFRVPRSATRRRAGPS